MILTPGFVPFRKRAGHSQANPRIHPLSVLMQTQRFEPLPLPLGEPPYHYDLETSLPGIGASSTELGKIIFHVVGDTGGVKNPDHQLAVAAAMVDDLSLSTDRRPVFFFHIGDVVYFNGQIQDYYDQFYEPYTNYTAPIISIPGNHDGDPINASQTSLDGWVAYFMQATPHVDPNSRDAPRVTMSLPNVYFTLNCPFVTIVGMYTNVPEGGSIDSVQQQWLTNEFATAPADKALIVALHHPIYSFDDFHSGSARMATAVQLAINDSKRLPNLVMTAHVHNYQRIERAVSDTITLPFLVAGHGGYYNLHKLNSSVGTTDSSTGAHLVAADDRHWGYTTLTADANNISGTMTTVPNAGETTAPPTDSFSYPAAAQYLPDGAVATL
ncbi:MAG: metallophosphoesterase [Acidobacteriaceae bacterium]|nr:metallophosphoesterase [Acidobacteriaceae bacterium]MBV9780907.1 metallophosphoesterase [Acidobacteriaceae bacterium]